MLPPFVTEPYSDFSDPAPKAAYELALAGVAGQLGEHAPLVIAGSHVTTGEPIVSVDPAQPDSVVGTASSAGAGRCVTGDRRRLGGVRRLVAYAGGRARRHRASNR